MTTASTTDAVPFVESLKRLPLIRNWRRARSHAHFLSDKGLFAYFGVFKTFAEARRSLPPSREFDQHSLAAEYVEIRTRRVFSYDYPIIHWLNVAIANGASSILDIGGSVGVHYLAYRRHLNYPPDLTWQVYEVPAIAQVGRKLAERDGEARLSFIETLDQTNLYADVWLAAGAVQYIEDAQPSALLAAWKRKPKHLLFDRLPLYDGEDFVTTQNIDPKVYAPLHVYNRRRFVTDIENRGFGLVDSWHVHERDLYLPSHPERSFQRFSGLYFRAL